MGSYGWSGEAAEEDEEKEDADGDDDTRVLKKVTGRKDHRRGRASRFGRGIRICCAGGANSRAMMFEILLVLMGSPDPARVRLNKGTRMRYGEGSRIL